MTALIQLKPTTLRQQWEGLMNDIQVCDNMILGDDEFDQNELDIVEEQTELRTSMEEMCQQLGIIEEVMHLKYRVDCDCFYTGGDHQ